MNFVLLEWFGFNKWVRYDMMFIKIINGEISIK